MTTLPTANESELALLGAIVIDQTILAAVTERRLRIADSVRSPAFLAKLLVDGAVHAVHAVHYAREVNRASTLRRLALIAGQLGTRAADPAADPAAIAGWVEAQLIGMGVIFGMAFVTSLAVFGLLALMARGLRMARTAQAAQRKEETAVAVEEAPSVAEA